MKTLKVTIGLVGLLFLAPALQAKVLLYLVDEKEQQELEAEGIEVLEGLDEEQLSRLMEDDSPPGQMQRWERLSEKAYRDQQKLVLTLEDFLISDFNPMDYFEEQDFDSSIDQIVELIFNAPTHKDYIQRLYIVNQYYRDNLDEFERFEALHIKLTKENLSLQKKRRQMRELIIGTTSIAGAALGAYFTFKATQRAIPILAEERTLGLLMKWGGRGFFIAIGTGAGAALGAYVGFLGSDYLLANQFEYFDPIEKDEDLTDLLDIIDSH